MKTVKINGRPIGHSVTWPTEIIKLFQPVRFCGGGSQYSLAAWTNYLDDFSIGSLVFIALKKDLHNFKAKKKPFIYVHHPIKRRGKEQKMIKDAKVGKQFTLPCGCTYKVLPLSEFPQDIKFDIIITGHNVDER